MKRVRLLSIFITTSLVSCLLSVQITNAVDTAPVHPIYPCKTAEDTNCIESINVKDSAGKITTAQLVQSPARTNPNQVLWRLPGITFEDGEDTFNSEVNWRKDGEPLCWVDSVSCSYHSGSIDLIFFPTGNVPGKIIEFPKDSSNLQCGTKAQPSTCGMWLNFGRELTWDMVIRLQNFHPGMLSGRSKNADFIDLDPSLRISESHRFRLVGTNYPQDTSILNEVRSTPPGTRAFADAVSDGYIVWIWDAANDAIDRIAAECQASNIAGPIPHLMFNTYNIGDPRWEASDQSFNMTVESAHFSANGQLAKGYYEMFFPSKVAECLWKLKDITSAKATISVTEADGSQSVATVSQSVTSQGMTVIASNFHFSTPTLKVKLVKEEPAALAPSTQVSPPKAKSKSVTCIKGKLSKVVKGINPVCPKGYTKK